MLCCCMYLDAQTRGVRLYTKLNRNHARRQVMTMTMMIYSTASSLASISSITLYIYTSDTTLQPQSYQIRKMDYSNLASRLAPQWTESQETVRPPTHPLPSLASSSFSLQSYQWSERAYGLDSTRTIYIYISKPW